MYRDLLILALALFTWGIGESVFFFFQPLYLEQMGASHMSIGTIMGFFGIALTVAHLPAGYLADRIGRRPLLRAAWAVGMLTAWIMALAQSLPVFVTGLLLYGLTSFVSAPLSSYVTAARGKLSVGRALTLVSATFNLGAIIGPGLGGFIADWIGLRRIYLVAASIFVLSNLFIWLLRKQKIEEPHPDDVKNGFHLNSRYKIYLGVIFLAVFAAYLPQSLSPNYLQNQHALSIGQIGQLGSASAIGVVTLNLVLGQIDARLGYLLAQASVGLFAFLLWRGTGMPWFVAGYFLLGGFRTMRSLATAQTRELVHAAKMGLAYGLTETASGVAMILAPPLAGFLYERNPVWMYLLSIALTIVSLAVGSSFLFFRKQLIQETFLSN